TTYPSYALNLAQLGALCISNLCATKPLKVIKKKLFKSKNLQNLGLCVSKLRIGGTLILNNDKKLKIYN
ncbi:hypothetical protein BTG95_12115, partial [Acinetobacter baumannii]|uniref:hypothetical protein n=1 Tax=Acinetobacter baumannii TaxID=470 RepID=UPI0009D0E9AE